MNTYHPIASYGIIGNCKTTALIQKGGSIDFFCYPEFDSPSVFAKILDHQAGGSFQIAPLSKNYKIQQHYLSNTNVLLTRFLSDDFTIDILDFMPVDDSSDFDTEIIRVVKMIRGQTELEFKLNPALDYARTNTKLELVSNHRMAFVNAATNASTLEIQASIEFSEKSTSGSDTFTLKEGENAIFCIQNVPENTDNSFELQHFINTTRTKLKATITYWRDWLENCSYEGHWSKEVYRSALLLKLLTHKDHGAPIAAPTFSLPELAGGTKNWDYRYVWIRDASFTMYAFIRLGFYAEASKFMKWIYTQLEDQDCSKEILQIMYKANGSRDLEEEELESMEGYKKSAPVRIGNAATDQLQLDIYGELLDTIYLYDKHIGLVPYSLWEKIVQMINQVCANWEEKDHGIWEVREAQRHYLYSRLMCWVAVDRAIRLAAKRSFPCELKKWEIERDRMYLSLYNDFWNEDLQSFVHFKSATTLDASVLMMPLVRYISPYDKRWIATMKAVEKHLVFDVLVYRNMNDTHPKEEAKKVEGTFLISAFWYIECLSRSGALEKAAQYFDKLLAYGNHLGLFAEEIDLDGAHLGNFPQAFSHLGLISTAYSLNRNVQNDHFVVEESFDWF